MEAARAAMIANVFMVLVLFSVMLRAAYLAAQCCVGRTVLARPMRDICTLHPHHSTHVNERICSFSCAYAQTLAKAAPTPRLREISSRARESAVNFCNISPPKPRLTAGVPCPKPTPSDHLCLIETHRIILSAH